MWRQTILNLNKVTRAEKTHKNDKNRSVSFK